MESGLYPRILVVYATSAARARRKLSKSQPLPVEIKEWARKIRGREAGLGLAEGNLASLCMTLPFSAEAEAVMEDILFVSLEKEMSEEKEDVKFGSLHNRSFEHTAKLALICALSKDPFAVEIDEESVIWSWQFVQQSTATMIYLYSLKEATTRERVIEEVKSLTYNAGEDGITYHQLENEIPDFDAMMSREKKDLIGGLKDGAFGVSKMVSREQDITLIKHPAFCEGGSHNKEMAIAGIANKVRFNHGGKVGVRELKNSMREFARQLSVNEKKLYKELKKEGVFLTEGLKGATGQKKKYLIAK